MAKKKEVYKVKPLNENKKNIIAALIDEYDIQTADDIEQRRFTAAGRPQHRHKLVFPEGQADALERLYPQLPRCIFLMDV